MVSPMSLLSAPHFHDETAAFEYVEARLWPSGPTCPFCGECERIGRLKGKTTRPGLRKCYACRKPFTVRVGTVFESSHVALRIWLQVIHLLCSSKKGISTRQIHRAIGGSMTTAWFLTHRIREAMAPAKGSGRIGGEGHTVEIDETFVTNSPKTKKRADGKRRYQRIMSLVDRNGDSRTLSMDGTSAGAEMYRHLAKGSHVMTDGATGMRFSRPTPPLMRSSSTPRVNTSEARSTPTPSKASSASSSGAWSASTSMSMLSTSTGIWQSLISAGTTARSSASVTRSAPLVPWPVPPASA